ncbi:hypothetical protein EOD39_16783 [Acipenser ruthenus]|uniref:Uncharacterized protein n=1 Tax=Acipenser ruthenus TaxID=7906 RepID=A0A444V524_ACIRT|nr:hypothetical protein EOD39_16783 [Acipenser ruthenus]
MLSLRPLGGRSHGTRGSLAITAPLQGASCPSLQADRAAEQVLGWPNARRLYEGRKGGGNRGGKAAKPAPSAPYMEEKTRASATVLGAKAGLDQVDWISLTKSGKGGSVLLCTGVAEGNQEPWGSLSMGHSTPRHQAALTTRASTEVLEMPPVPAAACPASCKNFPPV